MPSLIRSAALVVAPIALLLSYAPSAAAQTEEPAKNLQVLPKDIPRPKLIGIMRGFTSALGVRCEFCHVETSGPRAPGVLPFDFPKDDKENKKKARLMLKMVATINGDYLAKLEEGETPPKVECETCHRGVKEPPEPLATKLLATANAKGVDAAFDQYGDLKGKYAEAGLYDFRDQTLLRMARALGENKKPDESMAALKKTKALFPQSANVAATLGFALLEAGDAAGARAELERALSIDPNNMGAKSGLERLNHPPAPPPATPK